MCNCNNYKFEEHIPLYTYQIGCFLFKFDMAEEEGIIFMLEETCNRVKLALAKALEYITVRDVLLDFLKKIFTKA